MTLVEEHESWEDSFFAVIENGNDDLNTNQRYRGRKKWIGLFITLLAAGLLAYGLFGVHQCRTTNPVSIEQASDCPIPLPDSARNIQFFTYAEWIAFAELVRFEAPYEDCVNHIPKVLNAWRKDFDDRELYPDPAPPSPIEPPVMPSSIAREQGIDWFDIENIQQGITTTGGGSGIPRIWIDKERGIFYYQLTD